MIFIQIGPRPSDPDFVSDTADTIRRMPIAVVAEDGTITEEGDETERFERA